MRSLMVKGPIQAFSVDTARGVFSAVSSYCFIRGVEAEGEAQEGV